MAKWKWGEKIGSGGFGVVRHAIRLDDELPFAVKFLLERYAEDEEALARFKREVNLQRSLTHPNILPVVGVNLEASPPWFTMPIAESTLLDKIGIGLAEDDAEALFAGILAGVAHAHENGVVHRDLKPENVIITHDGVPQVSDFGLGRNLLSDSTTLTVTMMGAGSFPYIAPEQMTDLHSADERADIYALGKILQQMLTGDVPVRKSDPKVPSRYRYFIARCTEDEPDHRYRTMVDVAAAFKQVTRGIEQPEAPVEGAERLIDEWMGLPAGEDIEKLRELHELLERHGENMLLYQTVVPKLPDGLLEEYVNQLPSDFRRLLERYDEHVSGGLNFDYCDVVASFYRKVWDLTEDVGIRKMLLTRLIQMGSSHNRFFVGGVVGRLLPSLNATAEVMMAADVVQAEAGYMNFFEPYLENERLARPIADALESSGNGQGPDESYDDDIPF